MLFLLRPYSESDQIVDLPAVESEDKVRINVGPVFKIADCNIAGPVPVDVTILDDAVGNRFLLMLEQVAVDWIVLL